MSSKNGRNRRRRAAARESTRDRCQEMMSEIMDQLVISGQNLAGEDRQINRTDFYAENYLSKDEDLDVNEEYMERPELKGFKALLGHNPHPSMMCMLGEILKSNPEFSLNEVKIAIENIKKTFRYHAKNDLYQDGDQSPLKGEQGDQAMALYRKVKDSC